MTALFRETIRKSAEGEGKWVLQAGSIRQYALIEIRIEPGERGSGISIRPLTGDCMPQKFFPSVEQGVMKALAAGPVARYEMTDVRASVLNASYEEETAVDAFATVTEWAVREALQKADPYVLEPLTAVSVTVPEEFVGSVIGNINGRAGMIIKMEVTPDVLHGMVVIAHVPERTMLSFASDLQSFTQNRASVASAFHSYQELPSSIARLLQFCPGCERKVLPQNNALRCPDCGSDLDSGADYMSAV